MRNRQASALSIPARAAVVVPLSNLNDPKYPCSGLRHYELSCYDKDIPEAIPLFHNLAGGLLLWKYAELHIALKSQLLLGHPDGPDIYADTLKLWFNDNLLSSQFTFVNTARRGSSAVSVDKTDVLMLSASSEKKRAELSSSCPLSTWRLTRMIYVGL